jgi:hypothetical protein
MVITLPGPVTRLPVPRSRTTSLALRVAMWLWSRSTTAAQRELGESTALYTTGVPATTR